MNLFQNLKKAVLWLKIDLHIHTKYSIDCLTEPKDLIAKARKLGIIPATTDHNDIRSHAAMKELKAQFIPGEEISTDCGDLIGLYVNELIPKCTEFSEVMDKIHEQGALAFIPHMFDRTRSGVGNHKAAKKADIIEIFNARCMISQFNKQAEEFADKHDLRKAVGSDSHTVWEFGNVFSEVPDFDLENPKELLKALKKAKYVTKTAPFYVKGTAELTKFWKKLTGKN